MLIDTSQMWCIIKYYHMIHTQENLLVSQVILSVVLSGKLQLSWQSISNSLCLIFSSLQSSFLVLLVPLWDSEASSVSLGGSEQSLVPKEPQFPPGSRVLAW